MKSPRNFVAGPALSALARLSTFSTFSTFSSIATLGAIASVAISAPAMAQEQTLPAVTVRANPLGGDDTAQILVPAKVLAGEELRNKLGISLGDTLENELGVTSSGFGSAAARPIIRGLEGPRVKVLQNGMTVADLSAQSNDHAVAADVATARQIDILRGPAALLYGSGAIGGLVNVVNDRILSALPAQATGEAELRFGIVDRERSVSFSADAATGKLGLHLDGSARNTDNYRIPERADASDPDSANGRLPSSYTKPRSLGLGISHVDSWGHLGVSVDTRRDQYGIPTEEQAFIDLAQDRVDIGGSIRQPLGIVESANFKMAHTDYRHTEKEQDGTPATDFDNRAFETRWELAHRPLAGWRGTLGLQTERSTLSALSAETGRPNTIPVTKSSSLALFLVEEKAFGPLRANAGARVESVDRKPEDEGAPDRSFTLFSTSVGGLWSFVRGIGLGATLSFAQRAPAPEELYSDGPHESTATFDIGDADLRKETSRNLELTLQKTEGKLRWKANVFQNRVKNFIYGRLDGVTVDEDGNPDPSGELQRRFWSQGDATIRGVEAELSLNARGPGASLRLFADTSRGKLDGVGSLPLQPATRFGVETGYRQGAWRAGLSVLRARSQDRLATFEATQTPGYTRLDASLSWTQRYRSSALTWFAVARNLLDEDIRLSTSVLKETVPQPGRNLIVGVRTRF